MKLKKYIYTAILGCSALAVASCSDYLDVSKEMNENLTFDKVWDSPTYTRNWYGNVYQCMSEFSETGSESNAFKNPWSNMCGEISSQMGPSRDAMTAGYTASSASFHRWATLYQYIRQGRLFLENAHDEGVGSDNSRLTPEVIARMKDEVRFLIAYSYFSIFELYGPGCNPETLPYIDDAAYPTAVASDYPRQTVDEFVNLIDSILVDILSRDNLPESTISAKGSDPTTGYTYNLNECVRPTKILCRALRAKLWVYAASPLFNGGLKVEGVDKCVNPQGERIFPATEDKGKWQKAKQCLEELLASCEQAGHVLYEWKNAQGTVVPEMSIYRLFQDYNPEILWCAASDKNSYSDQYKMEMRTMPRDIDDKGYGTIGPTQESVDMFFTKNGLTISEDPAYHEDGLVTVDNTAYADDGSKSHADENVFNMYANREPRFYQAVIYQNKSWWKCYLEEGTAKPNYRVDFSLTGSAGPGSRDTPLVGYLLGKFKNRSVRYESSWSRKNYNRPSIIYRLAEFYLFYAEVLNEINPSDPKIIEYLDKVRARAGVPTYAELAANGTKDIIGNYEKQKEAIQRETFVELFCEGQWYFDIRRWMICGKGQLADQTRFSGMNEYGTTDKPIGTNGSFYQRTTIENRMWSDKMYLYPIHHNVIQLGQGNIPQNPGW